MISRLFQALIASIVVMSPAAVLAQSASTGSGQAYPDKPIRLIVPFAPGGTNDILARIVATHLSEKLGESMIVDNRPGADGIIGTEIAVKARPDGYTLLLVSSAYGMNPVVRKLPYDTRTALEFVAKIGASFLVLSVNPALPVKSVNDLLALAKEKPGQITLASSGGFMHFASALLNSLSKREFIRQVFLHARHAKADDCHGRSYRSQVA